MNLFELEGVTPEEVLAHPRHRAAQAALVKLIEQLRACSDVEEGYAFQQDLLEHVLAVERDRNSLSQALKRITSRKHPQAGAPEPQSGRDPAERETWQFEHDVCERVARQFRCVGDALAWRVFGYDRRHIIALCRNQSPGVMAGKKGLERERETVREAFVEDGRFALMHDLTNCLRIGDVTVFTDEGPVTDEVKTNEAKQERSTPRPAVSRPRAWPSAAGPRCPETIPHRGCTHSTSPSRPTWMGAADGPLPPRSIPTRISVAMYEIIICYPVHDSTSA